MSVRTVSSTSLSPRSLAGAVPQVRSGAWVRHPAWLELPEVTASEAKLVGLYAVFPDFGYIAMNCESNYTVNWGDGVTENFSSGVPAYHNYDYSDADLSGTDGPVTFSSNGSLVERALHGFLDGDTVAFFNLSGVGGDSLESASYYVVNATANAFQISRTPGGSPVTIYSSGTGTLLPYKQALVTVTPNGGALSRINLWVKHNASFLQSYYDTGWLDLLVGGSGLGASGLTISNIEAN